VVDERFRFVARLLDGEKMAGLCAEFGISRKIGYKIYQRYLHSGVRGLTDRSRRPHRHANQLRLLATEPHTNGNALEIGCADCGAHSRDRSLFSTCVRRESSRDLNIANSLGNCAPGRSRTCDPRLRRPAPPSRLAAKYRAKIVPTV